MEYRGGNKVLFEIKVLFNGLIGMVEAFLICVATGSGQARVHKDQVQAQKAHHLNGSKYIALLTL